MTLENTSIHSQPNGLNSMVLQPLPYTGENAREFEKIKSNKNKGA